MKVTRHPKVDELHRKWGGLKPNQDARSLRSLGCTWLQALETRGYSPASVLGRGRSLLYFFRWCEERGVLRPADVTKPMIERYQRHVFLYRKPNGKPLSVSAQRDRVACLQNFYRYLARNNQVLSNPAADVELPRMPFRLPRVLLSESEVQTVLAFADLATPSGLRDRALLEVLYAAGLRRSEVSKLLVSDVDFEGGTVMVRDGKWKKDRLVPIGERALAWVQKYVDEARQKLLMGRDEGALFLEAQTGSAIGVDYLTHLVHWYVEKAVGKVGSCHLFRHACATHMLEGGADVRFVQAMLGHSKLTSTQIYTHVAIAKLKAVHASCHPGALLKKRKQKTGLRDGNAGGPAPEAAPLSQDALLDELELSAEPE